MPTLHRESGFEFFFRASDRAEPSHVHVIGNGGDAKVWLVPVGRIARSRGYTSQQRERIMRITEDHRLEWLAAWDGFFGGGERSRARR